MRGGTDGTLLKVSRARHMQADTTKRLLIRCSRDLIVQQRDNWYLEYERKKAEESS